MSAADRERIEAIQQRVENATMGPWKDCAELDTDVPFVYSLAPECAGERLFDAEFGTPSDAEFVAHARQDVPWLLSQLSALSGALSACQQERDAFKTLASVGVWHSSCRPNREMAARELAKSQAIIDKLADTISTLQADLTACRAQGEAMRAALEAIAWHQVPGGATTLESAQEWTLGVTRIALAALSSTPTEPKSDETRKGSTS